MNSTPFLLLEFCIVCFIVIAWYVAKRDLNATAARQQAPDLREMHEILGTIEQLLPVLEQKLDEIETRLEQRFQLLDAMEQRVLTQANPLDSAGRGIETDESPGRSARFESVEPALPEAEVPKTPIEQALFLIGKGDDLREVARNTGLTISEIETAARMRELRSGRP
jgi:hypothetical protein